MFTFLIFQNIWSKATFVTHISGILAIFLLDDTLEIVVNLGSNAHGFFEGASPDGQDHELLHGKLVACMRAAVDHIEGLMNAENGKIRHVRIIIRGLLKGQLNEDRSANLCVPSDKQSLTGTGKMTSGFSARSAIWRYKGTSFSAAPALQTARDTPRMAFAPNLAVSCK